jgi:thiamine-phosphate pyrophosphorylase
MTLCLVTDRRRLGKALGAASERWADLLLKQVGAAIGAGVDLVQLRETDLEAGDLFHLATRILSEVPASRGRLVVNDRLDVALAAGAAGVHLRERSFAVDAVRKLIPDGFRVGRSVHDVECAIAARSADYLIAGTVLSTPSKPVSRLLGWDGLGAIVRAAEGRPVLGIGGLTATSMRGLAATGADGLAAIGAFIPDSDQELVAFVQEAVRNMRFAFDSTRCVS